MNVIPKNAIELYDLLKHTTDICGKIELIIDKHGDYIMWELYSNLLLNIGLDDGEGYIDVNNGLFHWHPENQYIYEDLCKIGIRGHILVIKKSFLYSTIFYMGPADKYKFNKNKKRHGIGRLYYFGNY